MGKDLPAVRRALVPDTEGDLHYFEDLGLKLARTNLRECNCRRSLPVHLNVAGVWPGCGDLSARGGDIQCRIQGQGQSQILEGCVTVEFHMQCHLTIVTIDETGKLPGKFHVLADWSRAVASASVKAA